MAEVKRKRITHHFEKQRRREAAEIRKQARAALSIEEQIQLLKSRPGNSAKELKKLELQLSSR